MRYLLDTHVILWAASGSDELPTAVGEQIVDPTNEIFVSIVSFWEISFKAGLGKLPLTGTVAAFQSRTEAMNIATVPISIRAIDVVRDLTRHHKDPFDRIIVATALIEGLTLITCDPQVKPYQVPQWWENG